MMVADPEKSVNKQGTNKEFLENMWKPGQSGNPKGRPKGRKSISDSLRRLLDEGLNDKDVCDSLALKALGFALAGDFRYFKEIIDRMEGKVPDHLIADSNVISHNINHIKALDDPDTLAAAIDLERRMRVTPGSDGEQIDQGSIPDTEAH